MPATTEAPPAVARAAGADQDGLERAAAAVRARGARAQLHVRYLGRTVLDRSFGVGPDDLFWTFSAGKPYVAMLVHLLAERGALSLDDPVALHWPGFGRHGKGAITVRHVLQHRSGLTSRRSLPGDALAMGDWARMIRRLEHARPHRQAGRAPAYETVVFGFVLGEVVRRVTGRPLAEVLRTELLAPMGVDRTFLGLPDDRLADRVPITAATVLPAVAAAVLNRPAARAAVNPSAGVSSTARDLAAFYAMLQGGGTVDGRRILAPETIEQALVPSSEGELDGTIGSPIRWSSGFQLGGPRWLPGAFCAMGRTSGVRSFGHNGSNTCIAWADPDRDLVVAYVTDRFGGGETARTHFADVSDLVLAACPVPAAEPALP